MAYIPPHKRHSKGPQRSTPVPEMRVSEFNRKLNLGSHKHNAGTKVNYVEYADHAVHRWFVCGLDNDISFPSSVHCKEFPVEPAEHKRGAKTLVLVPNNLANDNDEVSGNISRSPWELVAENVWPEILSACKIVKNEMEEKPTLAASFGYLLFNKHVIWYNLLSLESAREGQVAETALRSVRRFFYRGVHATYMEKIVNEIVPKIGVDFVEYKDIYRIKLSDSTREITCKCTVKEDKKLDLYKLELNPVRNMIADMSCPYKNQDLRLALCTKSTLSGLSDDEMNSIRVLINSAIPDPEVKGGLRWPMSKPLSGKYTVIGVWHTEIKSYKSPSLKLKVENVDRLIIESATGWKTNEIHLKWRSIVSEIQGGEIDTNSIYNGFKEQLRLIWDHFLSTDCKLSCLSPNLSIRICVCVHPLLTPLGTCKCKNKTMFVSNA